MNRNNDINGEGVAQLLLSYIGEDIFREGLKDTPARFAKAWLEWTAGYKVDVKELLTCFTDGADNYDEMVVVQDIPVYSHCEHHLCPFVGTATVAYIPDGRIVGLSKINRLVDAYARRLQVQERLTTQIANAMDENLIPRGVGVLVSCRHMCIESRGIKQQGSVTVTCALRGVFRSDPAARAEFMALRKQGDRT